MYDITFMEMIVGYLVFSSIYILLAAIYFRYRRKRKQKPSSFTRSLHIMTTCKMSNDEIKRVISEKLNTLTEPIEVLSKEENDPFSEAQKEYLKEVVNEVVCLVFAKISATLLNSPTTSPIPPAIQPPGEMMTEEEILSEPVLPVGDAGQEIASGHSFYYDEIGNLGNVMRGEQVPHREQMAAYHTARKMIDTELFEQMMGKMEGAKQNLTTLFYTIASKYNDPTSENPYKVYENVDYLPVKRKKIQEADFNKISEETRVKVRALLEEAEQPKVIRKEGDFDYSQYIKK